MSKKNLDTPSSTAVSVASPIAIAARASAPPEPVSFIQALRFWLKLGFISFGGPAGQIAIMHEELVERRRWISERRFLHALNYCMLLPGPEAQQLATYIGWLMHRSWGGIAAGVLFVLPSLFILIGLTWIYSVYGDLPIIAGLFYGIKPAVTAIVLQAAHRIGTRTLSNRWLWGIAVGAFVAIFSGHVAFPVVIGSAALIGYCVGRLRPNAFQPPAKHASQTSAHCPALIDDDTPTPEHARFRWSRLLIVAISAAVLWLIPMTFLLYRFGWEHTLTQISWFFSKAALLTFGGAYAVLPYVYQSAVEHYHWLSAPQMMDGLALGETTPGPLIMIVAYVGFIAGFQHAILGPEWLFFAGVSAACLATWFTFLPSFIFIFAGGPLIESSHNDLRFSAALSAITAAVVGVITNLALFFAEHVLWPQGIHGAFDWPASAITVLAVIALLRFKLPVIMVIFSAALLGLLAKSTGLD